MKRMLSFALLVTCAAASAASVNFAKLPLSFEPEHGNVNYLARGAGLHVEVRPDGAEIRTGRTGGKAAVRLRFAGASAHAIPIPLDPLPGRVNYFVGADPKLWRTDVPTYAKVEYRGVYPGIDVAFYGNQNRLEYDFRVQPNADPSTIRLVFDGAARPVIAEGGDLVIGPLRQHAPAAYQEGDGGRNLVDCRYVVQANHEVAIRLGAYDRKRKLVIDPVLSFATYVGGSLNDGVTSVKVDSAGNIYLAGFTSSASFPVRGAAQGVYGGSNSPLLQGQFGDAFVAKLNPAGTALLYATYLGGSGDDFATSIAVDSTGNAYVAGNTQSANFPTSAGALQKTYKGFTEADNNGFYNPGDGFVAKLNASGNQLVYSTYLGGTLNDLALGIAVDSNGDAVVVGSTESSDFPTTSSALASRFRGNSGSGPSVAGDGFVSILNPGGTALIYSTYLGGQGHDGASAVALDSQNNIYVCGVTYSSDFPVTPGAAQMAFKGVPVNQNGFVTVAGDAFITKLSAQGALLYSTYLGGANSDAATAIAVDSAGAVYVTGATLSTDFPVTPGALQSAYKGSGAVGTIGDAYGGDAFVTKLNPAGSAFVFSTYLGGRGDEAGLGIAVDSASNTYVTGFTLSSDFPVTSDALQKANAGFGGQGLAPNPSQGFPTERVRNTGDAFLTKLSPAGALTYSSFYGGSADDAGVTIALDAAGNPVLGGSTLSTALAGSASGAQSAFGGAGPQWPRGDGFIARFDFGGKVAAQPAKVNIVAGFNGTGAPGSQLATPFLVEVVDSTGAAIPSVQVAFTATGATVNPASAVTDASGRASTVVTLGNTVGSGSVTATVTGIPAATATLTINAGAAGPVVKAVVNGASFQTAMAGGSWITVFIDQTAPAAATANQVPLPTVLAGYRILVNGSAIPLYAVTPLAPSGTQLNAQLPYEVGVGNAQVVVDSTGLSSAPYTIAVQQTAPGIFVFGDNRAVAQNVEPDGSVSLNTADNPVPAGDYIIVYLTGQGPLDHAVATGAQAGSNPLSVPTQAYSAKLNNTPIPVAFLGMTPGQIALAQANIQIPRDTTPGTYTLVLTIGGAPSNGPAITVTNPRP